MHFLHGRQASNQFDSLRLSLQRGPRTTVPLVSSWLSNRAADSNPRLSSFSNPRISKEICLQCSLKSAFSRSTARVQQWKMENAKTPPSNLHNSCTSCMVDKHRINWIDCAKIPEGGQGRQSLWSAAGCLTGPQIAIQGSLPSAIQGPDPWSPDHSPRRSAYNARVQGPQLELPQKTHRPPTKGDTRNGLSQKLSQNHTFCYLFWKIYDIYNIYMRKGSKIIEI